MKILAVSAAALAVLGFTNVANAAKLSFAGDMVRGVQAGALVTLQLALPMFLAQLLVAGQRFAEVPSRSYLRQV